jgi:hypothetical protein
MKEITSSEFSAVQYQLAGWIIYIILGLVFLGIPIGIILSHFFVDSPETQISLKTGGEIAFFIFFTLGASLLSILMFYMSIASICDYVSQKIQIIAVTITREQDIKNGKQIFMQKADGTTLTAIGDRRWDFGEMPIKATLWRAKYSKSTLKIVLADSQKTYSINDKRTS